MQSHAHFLLVRNSRRVSSKYLSFCLKAQRVCELFVGKTKATVLLLDRRETCLVALLVARQSLCFSYNPWNNHTFFLFWYIQEPGHALLDTSSAKCGMPFTVSTNKCLISHLLEKLWSGIEEQLGTQKE